MRTTMRILMAINLIKITGKTINRLKKRYIVVLEEDNEYADVFDYLPQYVVGDNGNLEASYSYLESVPNDGKFYYLLDVIYTHSMLQEEIDAVGLESIKLDWTFLKSIKCPEYFEIMDKFPEHTLLVFDIQSYSVADDDWEYDLIPIGLADLNSVIPFDTSIVNKT